MKPTNSTPSWHGTRPTERRMGTRELPSGRASTSRPLLSDQADRPWLRDGEGRYRGGSGRFRA